MENDIALEKRKAWDFEIMLSSFHEWLLHADYSCARELLISLLKRVDDMRLMEKLLHIVSATKQEDFVTSFSQAKSSLNGYSHAGDTIPNLILKNQMSIFLAFFDSISQKNQLIILSSIIKILQNSQILHEVHKLLLLLYYKQKHLESYSDQGDSSSSSSAFQSPFVSYHKGQLKRNENATQISSASSNDSVNQVDSSLFLKTTSKSQAAKLPVHLIKKILGYVDERYLLRMRLVCKRWNYLIKQIFLESLTRQYMSEEAMIMQGASAKQAHPSYASKKLIAVPSENWHSQSQDACEMREVEERNVFCGAYNVLVLDHERDSKRCVHYSNGSAIVTSNSNRDVNILSISTGQPLFKPIKGHPASITSLHVNKDTKGSEFIFSGGYDTAIRCWQLGFSRCRKIMHGHRDSVSCLDSHGEVLVSGGKDGLVKAWDICSGKCLCTFKHSKYVSVTAVKILDCVIVSSCEKGLVKVWDLKLRKLKQVLRGHRAEVNCLDIDVHFVVSGGNDAFVRSWTIAKTNGKCLKFFRHPREVLCVQLLFLRIISGCADGKIRILNLLTGECIRVLRGNSKCDPVLSLSATEERLVINTVSNVLLLQFEPIQWKYQVAEDGAMFSKQPSEAVSMSQAVVSMLLREQDEDLIRNSVTPLRHCESRLSHVKSISRPCSTSKLMRFDYGLRLARRPQTACRDTSGSSPHISTENKAEETIETNGKPQFVKKRCTVRSKTFDDGLYLKIANASALS